MTFLDASVLLAAEDSDDANHRAALELLAEGDLATLDLAFYEVTNVAGVQWRRPAAAQRLRAFIGGIEAGGDLVRVDGQLLARAAQIADQYRISAYDAAYVAAAERVRVPLASCDQRGLVANGLARVPADCLVPHDPGPE